MKIALITTDHRELFRQYERETPWFGAATEALLQGLALWPEVEVHVLGCTRKMMPAPEKLADNIFFHSLLVRNPGWKRTGYQGCIRAVRRKLRELTPDIVHGHGFGRECGLAAVFSGLPCVLTPQGNRRTTEPVRKSRTPVGPWIAGKMENFALLRAAGVICMSKSAHEAIGDRAKRTWLVPPGIDSAFFLIEPAPVSPPRLLCVGTIDERHNPIALLRALDGLAETNDFELLFLGRLDRDSAFGRIFIELIHARPWCRYGGPVDRAGLRAHLALVSGVVLPAVEDSFPMVALEAMAAGVPVAAGRVGGVPELVVPGETGFLFDPLDRASIALETTKLLTKEGPAMAKRAKTSAKKKFHPKVIAGRHLEIYREVLEQTLL